MHHSTHDEAHLSNRNHWLRAAVLGANDGLISTASLLVGVAAANPSSHTLLLTGMAALTAGALSMAAGEYISVSSQADTEKADLDKERHELTHNAERELLELTKIYESRGLDHQLAHQVAVSFRWRLVRLHRQVATHRLRHPHYWSQRSYPAPRLEYRHLSVPTLPGLRLA